MPTPELEIIAEAAQGYEGSADLAKLLVKAAGAAKADAVKFQIVYAADLCEPGYRYYDLFCQLELPAETWRSVRELARERGLRFIADIFGPRALEVAQTIGVDGAKLHSTTFYDDALTAGVLALGKPTLLSMGGIEIGEVEAAIARHGIRTRDDIVMMYGFQAEPTPIGANNLARIPALRQRLGLDIGFMDHSDGAGAHAELLSAAALGLGVTVFEKHISLDRALELEDYVSALPPAGFARYAANLRELAAAIGAPALDLSEDERAYRGRALKRVIAARDLGPGTELTAMDIRLSRPAEPAGLYDPAQALGRKMRKAIAAGQPVRAEDLA